MPQQGDSLPAVVTFQPRIFCRGCGYALVGLESRLCPECGRVFDLGNQRTFARRPPRGVLWRWGRWLLALVLLLASGAGWLWWGWHAEQKTIAQLRDINATVRTTAIGSDRYCWVLGKRLTYLRERVREVELTKRQAAEIETIDFKSLNHLEKLMFYQCRLSDQSLSSLGDLRTLKGIYLIDVRKPNIAFLSRLPQLTTLSLRGTLVDDADLIHIRSLNRLQQLSLSWTRISDSGLDQLSGMMELENLQLGATQVTDKGLQRLKNLKSLRTLGLEPSVVTSIGVAKLKESMPSLTITKRK